MAENNNKTIAQVLEEYRNRIQHENENHVADEVVFVSIYTHSGKREVYKNIRNLSEDKHARIVEFDRTDDVSDTHMVMSGSIEQYEKVVR